MRGPIKPRVETVEEFKLRIAAIIRGKFRLWKFVADRFTDTEGTRRPLLRQIASCEQAIPVAQINKFG